MENMLFYGFTYSFMCIALLTLLLWFQSIMAVVIRFYYVLRPSATIITDVRRFYFQFTYSCIAYFFYYHNQTTSADNF